MKALSVRQPWASLIVCGAKDIENRSWPTKHRGPLLIHAGKNADREAFSRMPRLHPRDPSVARTCLIVARVAGDVCMRGGVIGVVDVVDCVQGHASLWAMPGNWHWVLANPRPLPFLACRGALGIFTPAATAAM